jgi:UDP-galactopyranose mutase
LKLVEIADTADEFIAAAEKLLTETGKTEWLNRVDAFLKNISWDKTWAEMSDLIDEAIEKRRPARSTSLPISGATQRARAGAST